jgi:cation transport regulator ChaC
MAFWYFGYGSNMALKSLRAKGVDPRSSERAVLRGWRLRFNVQHFFRHEGGVGNIEPTDDPEERVLGVLHLCEDQHLPLLDVAEAYPHGYDRISLKVETAGGERQAIAYLGTKGFLNEACRPTQRYLNLLAEGAAAAGLDPEYIASIRRHPLHQKPAVIERFQPPDGPHPIFTAELLAQRPLCTALAGAVFDMSRARWPHVFLRDTFGGKDTTLFHLKRMDTSDGSETLDDIRYDRLNTAQRLYLEEYLHAYGFEYVYVGRFLYD